MTENPDARFLALLVHRRLLPVESVQEALASGDPKAFLIRSGRVTEEQWETWRRTDAGARPELTRYELGTLLGEGGTARVFRAVDRKTGESIALKVLKSELASDRRALEAFVRESKLLIALDCPRIVKGLRIAKEGATYFCAMQLVDGVCLQDRIGEGRPLDERLALHVVMQVGEALAYLHSKGYVHRDVKPGNVMLTPGEQVVLIDLGFAVGAQSASGSETTAGTVHYISPEQARGHGSLDVRADIYSLGATLYHLVTGSLPFEGQSHEEVMAKQVLEALSGSAIRALRLSPQVHYFIEKMMAKEKEIRFQDPAELVAEIRAHLERQERERATEEEAEARAKARRKARRRRFL